VAYYHKSCITLVIMKASPGGVRLRVRVPAMQFGEIYFASPL
jgi:hypothetical protein